MGKKLTYEDVLSEAVYSILEVLRVKHEKAIIEECGTSDVLIMDTKQLGGMMDIITGDSQYQQMVNAKFLKLRTKYISEDNYDPTGETTTEQQKGDNNIPEDINFGF